MQPILYNPAMLAKFYLSLGSPNQISSLKYQMYFQSQAAAAAAMMKTQALYSTLQIPSINIKTEQGHDIVVKPEAQIKFETSEYYSPIITKYEASENSHPKIEEPTLSQESNCFKKDIKTEIQKMLDFLLFHVRKDNQTLIQNTRSHYLDNPILLQIYDKLLAKYLSVKKGKEDMIRYILRKAFKTIKTWIMEKEKVNSKKATILFCQRYLQVNAARLKEEGFNIKNEEDIIEFAMPYTKKSKTKTMNTSFVLEIFRSEPFFQAYQQFLPELNNILVQESLKRKEKFVEVLFECSKNSNFSKISNYPRLPWVDIWIEDVKNLAIAIMPGKRLIYNFKKLKC